jgi:hypothetical protein
LDTGLTVELNGCCGKRYAGVRGEVETIRERLPK